MKNIGMLDRITLDNELKSEFGEGNYELLSVGEGFLIVVNNIEYFVDKDGNVNDGNKVEVSNIENAGDLSKTGQYNGETEETAYRITCIEDLVEWANNYNNYKDSYIVLENTVNFNSVASYKDAKAKTTDINGNGKIEELITELTTENGFKPIAAFGGTFDGLNNEIRNIYIKREEDAGLISYGIGNYKNIGISGEIASTRNNAAGLCANGSGRKISNCYNKANVTAFFNSGGLVAGQGADVIEDCYNIGKIEGNGSYTGGIASGHGNGSTTLRRCYNQGQVKGNMAGGILSTNGNTIEECKNEGEVCGYQYTGGICGGEVIQINKSYNTGKLSGARISGLCYELDQKMVNCYNVGDISSKSSSVCGLVHVTNNKNVVINNCFNGGNVYTCGYFAGICSGILGSNNNCIQLNNVCNFGNITWQYGENGDFRNVNGIIKNNYGTVTMNKCYYLKNEYCNKAISNLDDNDDNVIGFSSNNEITANTLNENINAIIHIENWINWKQSTEYPILDFFV